VLYLSHYAVLDSGRHQPLHQRNENFKSFLQRFYSTNMAVKMIYVTSWSGPVTGYCNACGCL